VPLSSLRRFLDENSIQYVVISHSPAFTAQGIAALTHTPGQQLAKTVMVKLDGQLAMAVLSASRLVDLRQIKDVSGAKKAELANEAEFKGAFPDCETGAMPPFGNLYNIPVYLDEELTWDREVSFNAGTHRELVRMRLEDYLRLVKPDIAPFAAGVSETRAA
jgi:Ala-tRNA(Pro) deacylase